ncbi:hypothetical protein AA313_de0203674 [Arthrobotrys entomopaga]|nr:hypothetical protein AA313_de0203674 [Arthrobotrys entomopaga]
MESITDNSSLLSQQVTQESTISNLGIPYIQKPKSKLDTLSLELLHQVSGYLDARTALNFSFVNKSLHGSLAHSQYFWFQFGNPQLARFRKFDRTFDYYDYIVRAKSGKIKSACQMCLVPSRGIVRKKLKKKKVVCPDCLHSNVVSRFVVEKQIPDLDLKRIPKFRIKYKSRFYHAEPHLETFLWLPAVKRAIEFRYGSRWDIVMKRDLSHVKDFASSKAITDYMYRVLYKIKEETGHIFQRFHEESLRPYLANPMAYFRRLMDVHEQLSTQGYRFFIPSDCQEDPVDGRWIHARAEEFIQKLMGRNLYLLTPIWSKLFPSL